MAVQPLASQVGVAPACRALGVPRASFYRVSAAASLGDRSSCRAIPSRGPVCVRTRARPRRARQPALRRPVTGRGRRDAAQMKALVSVRRAHDVPDPGREPAGARAAQSAQSSLTTPSAELVATGLSTSDLVLGHHPAHGGPNAGRPSTSMSCSTSSAATSWAGWLPIGRTPRSPRRSIEANLSQAEASSPRCSHRAFGPRRADDQQVHQAQLLADLGVTRSN